MSHFATLVLTPSGDDGEVEALLAPFDENGREFFAHGSRWDWWTVGGRFTALLSTGYHPTDDPLNFERCWLCDGTGERPGGREQFGDDWYEHCHGCNGCDGAGERLKHAPKWQPHEADRQPVAALESVVWRGFPSAVVTPDGRWLEEGRPGWFGMQIPDEDGNGPKPDATWRAILKATLAQYPEAVAVVVDCHV